MLGKKIRRAHGFSMCHAVLLVILMGVAHFGTPSTTEGVVQVTDADLI